MTRTGGLIAGLLYHSELSRLGNRNRRRERPCAARRLAQFCLCVQSSTRKLRSPFGEARQ